MWEQFDGNLAPGPRLQKTAENPIELGYPRLPLDVLKNMPGTAGTHEKYSKK